jgi:Zn-dependent protease
MPPFGPQDLVFGFIAFVVFLFSTTCHEAAHALAAKIGGDSTAATGGQVSLNPVPHILREPVGMVVVPILSFLFFRSIMGWASAPFDPAWERRQPHRSAWMALAGPAANFTLMLLAAAGLRLLGAAGMVHYDPETGQLNFFAHILYVFFSLNLLMGNFNLLPVPPLDGSTAIMLLMSEQRAHRYLDWLRGSSYAMAGLIVGLLIFRRIFPFIDDFATQWLLRSHF